jgi:hypothetical protein
MNYPLKFLFAVHNHQPVGNFPFVFAKAFRDCYLPFFRLLRKHPGVKLTVHFSGPLWEYMQEKEPECLSLISELVDRRQTELLSGGFYEPILSVIPEEDRQGQIAMMNRFIEERFHVRPRGIWLTERVWEPSLPKTLAQAGIEYTLLDEEHFHYAGIADIHKYYITEDQGFPLKIFPVDKKLRYLIPFRTLDEIRSYLEEIRATDGLAILGDDGEKFGMWPGTKKWVYDEKWLENFFHFLETESGIQTLTYSEVLDSQTPGGRVYLPPASYEEMMDWVLEPEAAEVFLKLKEQAPAGARRFLRGGFFREFFLKYPESQHLHKRMLLVSRQVRDLKNPEAKKELYKSQGNDPFWHGVFGGLYLPHLREAAYSHLLQAEKMTPAENRWKGLDYDADGREELFWRGETFGFLLKPSVGGSIIEIDYYPQDRNLTDVLSRRRETYHQPKAHETGEGKSIHELVKKLPSGAERLLRYDWHPRYSSLDHFLDSATTLENFRDIRYGEQGDFVDQPYDWTMEGGKIRLLRSGHVWVGNERISVAVEKVIAPSPDEIHVLYSIHNFSDKTVSLFFGSEWNFYQIPEEIGIEESRAGLCRGRVSFEFSGADGLWHFPLQTLSQSEKGYDIIHQGFCLLPFWKIAISSGKKFLANIYLRENHGA